MHSNGLLPQVLGGISLLIGRDIIGDIIVCWVGYHYSLAGISLGISLFAGWNIITHWQRYHWGYNCLLGGISLLIGRDIIGDIIVCWMEYHSTFIIYQQGYHYLLDGISWPSMG